MTQKYMVYLNWMLQNGQKFISSINMRKLLSNPALIGMTSCHPYVGCASSSSFKYEVFFYMRFALAEIVIEHVLLVISY
jgi:hypothetical protein